MRRALAAVAVALTALASGAAIAPPAHAACKPGDIRRYEDQVYECIELRDGSTHWFRTA